MRLFLLADNITAHYLGWGFLLCRHMNDSRMSDGGAEDVCNDGLSEGLQPHDIYPATLVSSC